MRFQNCEIIILMSSLKIGLILFLLITFLSAQNCPQLCTNNCTSVSCSACYSTFSSNSTNISTTCSCPATMFLSSSNGLCLFCPITCLSCTSYSSCTSCIPGYMISNNYLCIPGVSTSTGWVSKNVSYEITNNSLQVANLFVSSAVSTSTNSFNNSNYSNYGCTKMSSYNWIGGYGLFGYSTKVIKSVYNIPPHQWLNIRFETVLIDSWMGNTFLVEINTYQSYNQTIMESPLVIWQGTFNSSQRFVDICGNSKIGDNLAVSDTWTAHNASSFKIRIRMNESETPFNASSNLNDAYFAIRQLYIRVGTCGRNCMFCSSPTQCTQCILPYVLSNGTCICSPLYGFPTFTGCQSNCLAGSYFNSTSNSCLNCENLVQNAQTCNFTTVLSCSIGYFYHSINQTVSCLRYCPLGFTETRAVPLMGNTSVLIDQCTACQSNCATCNGNFCIYCMQGFVYLQGTCIQMCPSSYFPNEGGCKRCPDNCASCSQANTCVSCNSGFTWLNQLCTPLCFNTTLASSSQDSTCKLVCDSTCRFCFGTASNQCTACSSSNMLLVNGSCVSSCPSNSFANSAFLCIGCPEQCLTCVSALNCITCKTGFFLIGSVCTRSCPSATYPALQNSTNTASSPSYSTCLPCAASCQRCKNPNFCLECTSQYILFNFTCVDGPPLGYRFDEDNRKFKPCPNNCLVCGKHRCSVCSSGFAVNKGHCVTNCGTNKFIQLKQFNNRSVMVNYAICSWKNPSCQSYNNSMDGSCIQCSYFLPNLIVTQGTDNSTSCFYNCPQFSVASSLSSCTACPNNCRRCNINMQCLECLYNYVINAASLISSSNIMTQTCIPNYCTSGYFSDSLQCQNCPVGCSVCEIDGRCTACAAGYEFATNSQVCITSGCTNATQYYNVLLSSCQSCQPPCKTCLSNSVCSSCLQINGSTSYIYFYGCVATCPQGYFGHNQSLSCRKCNPKCSSCSSFYNCTNCVSGYNILSFYDSSSTRCVAQCPAGFWSNSNICTRCFPDCQSCYGPSDYQCFTCYPNFYLDEGKCVYTCSVSKYQDKSGYCDWCDPSCSTCIGPSQSDCISCKSSYYLLDNQCYPNECPDASYLSIPEMNLCERCQFGCAFCTSPQFCQFCFPGYSLYLGWCYQLCPGDMKSVTQRFKNIKDHDNIEGYICVSCLNAYTSDCLNCNSISCTKCANGTFLYQNSLQVVYQNGSYVTNQCLTVCPAGTYVKSQQFSECVACQVNCLSCNSYSNCVQCNSGFNLINGYCSNSCPAGSYLNIYQNCSSCSVYCLTCVSSSFCTSCIMGSFLYYNTTSLVTSCITVCPNGYFVDPSGKCQRCLLSCSICSNINTCTQCIVNYTLSNGACINNNANVNCSTNCLVCSLNNCLKCNLPYLLLANITTGISSCTQTCPLGFYSSFSNCLSCNSSCIACNNTAQNCSKCQIGLYLSGQSCVSVCPSGTYAQPGTQICQSCPSGCVNCMGTNCLVCKSGMVLFNGLCYTECPPNTYISASTSQCYKCPFNCLSCVSLDTCTQCASGYSLLNNSCTKTCPKTTYITFSTIFNSSICQACSAPCYTCSNSATCNSCISNYILNGTICQAICSDGSYLRMRKVDDNDDDDNEGDSDSDEGHHFSNYYQCISCDQSCLQCTGPSNCQSCSQGYVLVGTVCKISCSIGTYPAGSGSCQPCSQYCLSCSGPNNCLVCSNSTVLFNQQCLSACPVGYYSSASVSSSQNQYICKPCSSQCAICKGPSQYQCISCISGYYRTKTSACVIVCPIGTFNDNVTLTCMPCPYGCLSCVSSTICTQCMNGFSLSCTSQCNTNVPCLVSYCQYCQSGNNTQCAQCKQNYYLSNNICLTQCPNSTYSYNGQCINCSQNCTLCTSTNCNLCQSGLYLYRGVCLVKCPSGTIPYYSSCQTDPCLYYNNKTGDCLMCSSPYLLSQNINDTMICVLSCPSATTPIAGQCQSCPLNCLNCSSPSSCTLCINKTYLYKQNCLSSCPIGTYNVGSVCSACTLPFCVQCSAVNATQVCKVCDPNSGTLLLNGGCIFTCPANTFSNTNACINCSIGCSQCLNASYCTACLSNYAFYSGKCLLTCPMGTFLNNGTCSSCISGCYQCSNSINCVVCLPGLSLMASSNQASCVNNCPSGFYAQSILSTAFNNSNNLQCVACNSPCLTCTSSSSCTLCINGYSLRGSNCVSTCPSGTFSTTSQTTIVNGVAVSTMSCNSCSSLCLTCVGSSTNCQSCASGYLLDSNGNCLSNCVSTTSYYSQSTRMCYNCSQLCYSCYGPSSSNCLSCAPPLQLYGGSCFSGCPFGYYPTATYVCQLCSSICASCVGSSSNCTLCNSPALLQVVNSVGMCVSSCLHGYYLNTNISTCLPCSAACLTCTSSGNSSCSTCSNNLFLVGGSCISVCPSGTTAMVTTSQQVCIPCPYGCISCTYSSQLLSCTQCKNNLYLVNGNCSSNCPDSTYSSPTSYSCVPCNIVGCKTCILNTSLLVQCNACLPSYYLLTGSCVTTCPSGFSLISGQCVAIPTCQYYTFNGNCLSSCPVGTFPSSTNNSAPICLNCSSFCASCTSSSSCISCNNNTYLFINSTSNSGSCVSTCPASYYNLNNNCVACPSGCTTCQQTTSGIACTSCPNGFFLLISSCVQTCPKGYYSAINNGASICLQCSSYCASCNGTQSNCTTCQNVILIPPQCSSSGSCTSRQYLNASNQCSNCDSSCISCYGGNNYECSSCSNASNILLNGQCLSKCPPATVLSTTSCLPCPSNCAVCVAVGINTSCTSCVSSYILTPIGSCVMFCNQANTASVSYYLANGQCQPCNIPLCLLCSYSGNQTQCSICTNNSYAYNQSCYSSCPNGTVPSNNICIPCPTNCASCISSTCTSCQAGFVLQNGQCVSNCGSGSYLNGSSCQYCSISYANCLNCSSSSCNSCQQPYLLNNGQCTSCIKGYFISSGICSPCSAQCLTCQSSSNYCLSCAIGYNLYGNNTCISTCPNGYYSALSICYVCSSANCQSCPNNICTVCNTGFKAIIISGLLTCQSSCPSATYYDPTSNNCYNCSPNCASCSSSMNCLSCNSPSILNLGYCISSCPMGYTNVNQSCIACLSGCKVCSSISNCSSCQSGLIITASGSCSAPPNNCTSGYYLNSLGSCSQCYPTCFTCNGGLASNCLTCFNSYILTNGICTQSCSDGQYYNSNNSTCQKCSGQFSNCASCSNVSCTSCISGYMLSDTNCSLTCPIGTYIYNQQCLNCPSYCLNCSGSNSCNKCTNSSFILVNGLCYSSCPVQTYFNNGTCISCTQTCITCSVASTNCSSCITPYFLDVNTCVVTCPNGTYGSNYTCYACGLNCMICDSNSCSKCISTYYLVNGTCRSTCPSGYYIDSSSNRCIQCVAPCNVCSSRTSCSSCISPSILSNNQCISNCSSGTYYSSTLSSCTNCSINHCGYCPNASCLSCQQNYYSMYTNGSIKYCVPNCTTGFFADPVSMNCTSCFTNCYICSNSTFCNMCSSGYYIVSVSGTNINQCLNSCPLGYFVSGLIPSCQSCGSNCNVCFNKTYCEVCSSEYFLLLTSDSSVKCVKYCPENYFTPTVIDGSGSCGMCSSNCISCYDSLTCIECASSFTIVSGSCTPSNCVNCLTCNTAANTCNHCLTGYYLFSSACPSYCPDGYYADVSSGSCQTCVVNCIWCLSGNSCGQCITGYIFINGTGCANQGLIQFGILGNMSGFTSNITQIVATIYVSTSSGPIAFGTLTSTYGPMQFCQFMYLLQGNTGGNEELSTFLNSLSTAAYTTGGASNGTSSQSSNGTSSSRLLTSIQYTSTFLQTNAPIFFIMLAFICAYISVIILEKYNTNCCMSCPKLQTYIMYICTFMHQRFKYIYVDCIMWISYLPFLYFSILQLKYGGWSSGLQAFSSIIAIAIIIIYPMYPIFILRKLFDKGDDLTNYSIIARKLPLREEDEVAMCSEIKCCQKAPLPSRQQAFQKMVEMSLSPYIESVVRPVYNVNIPEYSEFKYFKLEHWRLAYAAIKYTRKFLFVLIVALCNDPIASLSLLIVFTIAYMLYLIVLKPKEKLYLILELILESLLLFFLIFMLVFVVDGGANVTVFSVITHAIGFLMANCTLGIAIVLNLMSYYSIFCCIYDLLKHIKTNIEIDQKQKMQDEIEEKDQLQIMQVQAYQHAELADMEEKFRDKDMKQQYEIRKSRKKNDDEMTVENDDEENNYDPMNFGEKEFDVRSSMINKKKTFKDNAEEDQIPNLRQTELKDSTDVHKRKRDRHNRDKKHIIEPQVHTSEQMMGHSKISTDSIEDGLLKQKQSKFKREVNNNGLLVSRGQVRQPTDNFRRKAHSKKNKFGQQQSIESLFVPDTNKNRRSYHDEHVVDIKTGDRLISSNPKDTLKNANFIEGQPKNKSKQSSNNEIDEGNFRQRQKKSKQYMQNQPNDGTFIQRQGRKKIEGQRNNLDEGIFADRNRKNLIANQHFEDNENGGKFVQRVKNSNPFGEFEEIYAEEDRKAKQIKEQQMREREKKSKSNQTKTKQNELLLDDFFPEAIAKQKISEPKKQENKLYKGSDEEVDIGDGNFVDRKKENKFRKNTKNISQQQDIDAKATDIKTKKAQKPRSTKEFVEDSPQQLLFKERQGKQIKKLASNQQSKRIEEQNVYEARGYDRQHQKYDKKKLESYNKQVQELNILEKEKRQAPKKETSSIYEQMNENLAESIVIRQPKRAKRTNDGEFEQSNMQKQLKQKIEKSNKEDYGMKVSDNIEQSYDDIIRKNKQKIIKPQNNKKSQLLDLEQDQFEDISYVRPESKIGRPSSKSKDFGLGSNSRNEDASDNQSREIRKQRQSAIQKVRSKSKMIVKDDSENEDKLGVGSDSRRVSKIANRRKKQKGVLNIEDKSENEDIQNINL